jgi:hypothetical protein
LALENRSELARVLTEPRGIGAVFARHAYGMERWVELLATRLAAITDSEVRELLARLVADNERHAALFRARASAHGVDPGGYSCPPEGEAIYARMRELHELDDLLGYALGSLDHFADLLAVYAEGARGEDLAAIETVHCDVADSLREIHGRVDAVGRTRFAEAHELYRVRELVEARLYARAA